MKAAVRHWRYENGFSEIPLALRDKNGVMTNDRMFNEDMVGWHCWVNPDNDEEFEKWMEHNMIGKYDCTFRFNSGSPIFTVHIIEDQDATLFKLTWM